MAHHTTGLPGSHRSWATHGAGANRRGRVGAAVRPDPLAVAVLAVGDRDHVVGRAVDHQGRGRGRLAQEVPVDVVVGGLAVRAAARLCGDRAQACRPEATVEEVDEEAAARESGGEDPLRIDAVGGLERRDQVEEQGMSALLAERGLEVERSSRASVASG